MIIFYEILLPTSDYYIKFERCGMKLVVEKNIEIAVVHSFHSKRKEKGV